MEHAIDKALSAYESPESQISITLFRAAVDAQSAVTRPSSWKRLVRELEIRPIVGDGIQHDNIMREPHALALAANMDECIARALSERETLIGAAAGASP
jgi:thioesterase domain-containing protein